MAADRLENKNKGRFFSENTPFPSKNSLWLTSQPKEKQIYPSTAVKFYHLSESREERSRRSSEICKTNVLVEAQNGTKVHGVSESRQ